MPATAARQTAAGPQGLFVKIAAVGDRTPVGGTFGPFVVPDVPLRDTNGDFDPDPWVETYATWESLRYLPGGGAPSHQEALPDYDQFARTDQDGDGVPDGDDNCPGVTNPGRSAQPDLDADGFGDACDPDADGDGIPTGLELVTGADPLSATSTPEFAGAGASCGDGVDNDRDSRRDGADTGCRDRDGDRAPDLIDNCPAVPNAELFDSDGDGIGDECERVARRVSLALAGHLVASGRVTTVGDPRCARRADVRIQRRTGGAWRTVGATRTAASGSYSVRVPDQPGDYRAVAPQFRVRGERPRPTCASAKSQGAGHEHTS